MAARRWHLLSALTIGVLALAGCTAGGSAARDDIPHDAASGGQTLSEMRGSLDALTGITVAEIDGGGKPNIKGNTGYTIALELEPGYRIVDGSALVDFIVTSVWSVREGYMPNAQIGISVRTPAGQEFDVASAAAEAGWVQDAGTAPSAYSSVAVVVSDAKEQGERNLERLGSWPGEAPDAPEGITVRE